ncbi:uncharacterized protein LACBIDRAFT_334135 [Laccaria bicolor S238N-H82]|uniref:Predicted protein n=1 Tax=Laccaria bicolor (strain S238N-H82 / ATCC MYA-4686) TaxID=486041 RepID=B0DY69_LACBS|nr:uncharacterized protein LACBIDRAFT_334135 [Laccaria bicolor S238N-H82]EDR00509.1 predicted protein [Laccaria bicolor S238N-H82]|eukprot:XP_001888901.1 predicted protein [Laccaria bicolor S238N-H82]
MVAQEIMANWICADEGCETVVEDQDLLCCGACNLVYHLTCCGLIERPMGLAMTTARQMLEEVPMDADESDSDNDEYQPLSPAEESEVHEDVAYFISSRTSSQVITSPLYEGKDPMGEYMAEMDEANRIVVSSVKQIISTLSSTLYALSIHWTKEFKSGDLSIPDFIPSSTSLPCLTELYLCINLRSYTWDSALRRLRFTGSAWSVYEGPYDTVKRMPLNLTHIRTKTHIMGTFGRTDKSRHTHTEMRHDTRDGERHTCPTFNTFDGKCRSLVQEEREQPRDPGMNPPRILNVNGLVLAHLGVISGEVRGTHLAARWVPLLVRQVALDPRRWASALDSVCGGIFVGRFRQRGCFILGAGLLPSWVDGRLCGFSGGFVSVFMGVICMRNPEAYDADRWEAHWAAGLRGEAGHWPEPEDLILSVLGAYVAADGKLTCSTPVSVNCLEPGWIFCDRPTSGIVVVHGVQQSCTPDTPKKVIPEMFCSGPQLDSDQSRASFVSVY